MLKTKEDGNNVSVATVATFIDVYPIWYDYSCNALRWNPVPGAISYSIMTSDDPNKMPPDPNCMCLPDQQTNVLPIPVFQLKNYVRGRANTGGTWGRPSQIPH